MYPNCTDATGPDDATKGIIYVHDIFGFKDQSLQGADILSVTNKHQSYKVLMPDWFDGEPAALEMYVELSSKKEERGGGTMEKRAAYLPDRKC